jgi:MFS family permease
MGVGFGLTALAVSAVSYALSLVVWTVGEIVTAPAVPALVAVLAGNRDQGAYQGILNATWGIGAVLGPVLGTAAFAAWGGRSLWLACGLAGIVAAAGLFAVRKPLAMRFGSPGKISTSVEVAG